MPIGSDWAIDFVNKRVYRNVNNNVYDVNALYSWLMDQFDELTALDDTIPMTAQTPTEYTMVNGWFIDDESVKYLKNGAIKTSGYLNKIQVLTLQSAGYTNCVAADVGKMVTDDAANTGNLLAYNNTTRKWFIGWTATIASGSVMAITTGTGAGTAAAASVTGEDLFANVYTLGTIAATPNPQIYIFQDGAAIAEWSDKTNWDRGHIDVLVKVKEAGTEINGAVVTVFARQYGDLFDNFEIDLTAGGRNAVPLSTSVDLDNTTGEYYMLYDNEGSLGPFDVGEVISKDGGGWSAEVIAVLDWGASGRLTIGGLKGTPVDNDAFTGETSGCTADVNGTIGDTYLTYSAEGVQLTVGLVCTGGTSAAKRVLRGIQDDGTTGKYVFQVSTTAIGTARDPYYKAFSSGETVTDTGTGSITSGSVSTTVVSGFDDITVAFVNGTCTKGSTTGTFVEGERVTFTGGSGILLRDGGATATLGNMTITAINTLVVTGDISAAYFTASSNLTVANTMTQAFEQATDKNYDIVLECGNIYEAGRTLAQVYEYLKFICREDSVRALRTVSAGSIVVLDGEEYILSQSAYSPKKASPFGTFAGGKLFGAQGVWLVGMATSDVQAYQLIDSDGVTQSPPNKQKMAVTGLVSGDKVAVFRTAAGVIDKSMYSSHATANTNGASFFEILASESIAADTPSTGVIRLRDVGTDVEQRHTYTAWSNTTKRFTGLSPVLQQAYDGADKAYIPMIDKQTAATSEEVTLIYTADRAVMIRVRKYAAGANNSILPFETTGTYGATGLSIGATRTVDTIAT